MQMIQKIQAMYSSFFSHSKADLALGVWSALWGVRKCLSCPIQGTAGIASCMFTKCLPSLRAPGQIVHQLSLVQPMLMTAAQLQQASHLPSLLQMSTTVTVLIPKCLLQIKNICSKMEI